MPEAVGLTAVLALVFGAVSAVLFLLGGPGIGDLRVGWLVLVLSASTVKTHVGNVLAKLGCRDRVQAVVFAYEHGIVCPGR